MAGKPRKWSDEDLRAAVAAATSWEQVTKILGLAGGGGSYRSIKRAAARLELDASHFRGQGWNKGLGKGRNLELQRAAQRRWYENNKQLYLDRNDRRRRKLVAQLRSFKDEPCTDCGGRYPYFAMEFDHRDDEVKEFNIADGVRSLVGTGRLVAEIKKCDLVCVICHRFRTALRAGWDGVRSEVDDKLSLLADDT